jgi:hypothetical protein
MKRLLMMPLLLCALMLGVAPAAAGPPTAAAGAWTYEVDLAGLTSRSAGNTTFLYATEFSTFTGTFAGTSVDEFVVVCHQQSPDVSRNYVKGTIEFTGDVEGQTGTMVMKFVGKQTSDTCDPSGAIWSGTWVILQGGGELADLHGHGTWTGPSFDLDYAGQVHFD